MVPRGHLLFLTARTGRGYLLRAPVRRTAPGVFKEEAPFFSPTDTGKTMSRVKVDDLKPGMVLAEDVRDPLGRLLISAGTALTDRHGRVLRKWGILAVRIQSEEEEPGVVVSEELLRQAEEELAERFKHFSRDHPAAFEIHQIAVEFHARKKAAVSAGESDG